MKTLAFSCLALALTFSLLPSRTVAVNGTVKTEGGLLEGVDVAAVAVGAGAADALSGISVSRAELVAEASSAATALRAAMSADRFSTSALAKSLGDTHGGNLASTSSLPSTSARRRGSLRGFPAAAQRAGT